MEPESAFPEHNRRVKPLDELRASPASVLCLFPCLVPDSTGGAQLSGRLAWEALTCATQSRPGRVQFFYFCASAQRSNRLAGPDTVVARSRWGAVRAALSRRWGPELILVWHAGLLKLLPLLRVPHAKVVLFLHSVEVWQGTSWLTSALLHRVDLFLSNSTHSWERFLAAHPWLVDVPHRTVHLGIASPITTPPPAPTHPPAALMLARLGRHEDYKGHREMIAAWPQVLERIPDARLWIAGEGNLRPDLERMVQEHGLGSFVRFWGWVPEDQKQELLTRCRCLALPSRGEGFGLVYLEAMRMGRPCLVSTLDAGREVVNPPEAGLAVDPRDPQALTDAVCQLLTSGPEWDRWSQQGRQRYEERFTAQHFQERLVAALFEDV